MRLGPVDPVRSIGDGNRLPSSAIWETATGCPAEFAGTKLLNSGLRGVLVGTWANALRANGLKPFFRARKPPVVKAPIVTGPIV